jgi:acetyltransferase-like isoleucine patch superfamily enzyme
MPHKLTRKTYVGKSPVSIGRFTYGIEDMTVRQWGEGASLDIASFCSIAEKVQIFLGGNHRTDWITTFPFGHIFQSDLGGEDISGHPATNGSVLIGNDVWIGRGATIMSGITIGDGAVIAANSIIVKDVLPYSIVGGNPASHIKYRFTDEIIALLLKLKWWELQIEEIRNLSADLCATPNAQKLEEFIKTYRK